MLLLLWRGNVACGVGKEYGQRHIPCGLTCLHLLRTQLCHQSVSSFFFPFHIFGAHCAHNSGVFIEYKYQYNVEFVHTSLNHVLYMDAMTYLEEIANWCKHSMSDLFRIILTENVMTYEYSNSSLRHQMITVMHYRSNLIFWTHYLDANIW